MKNKSISIVNVVSDTIALLGKEYRVENDGPIRMVRIYFNSRFCTECLLSTLMNIPGLCLVGVNCDERFVLATY